MAKERKLTTYVGGSDIPLSDVIISHAPNEHAPCFGCVFFKQDKDGFYCNYPDAKDSRECNPGFGALATVYRKRLFIR